MSKVWITLRSTDTQLPHVRVWLKAFVRGQHFGSMWCPENVSDLADLGVSTTPGPGLLPVGLPAASMGYDCSSCTCSSDAWEVVRGCPRGCFSDGVTIFTLAGVMRVTWLLSGFSRNFRDEVLLVLR